MNVVKKLLLVCSLAIALSACHDNPAPQQTTQGLQGYAFQQPPAVTAPAQPAPNVTVVTQAAPAPSNDGMLTGALLGGVAGYMAGSANRQPDYHSRPVYVAPRTVYNTKIVKQKIIVNSVAAPAPVVKPVVPVVAKPAPTLSLAKTSSPSKSFGGFQRRK